MSQSLRHSIPILNFLTNSDDKTVKPFFSKTIDTQLVQATSEIAYNIIFNNFPLDSHTITKIRPLKTTLELLSSVSVSYIRKRNHLRVHGLQFVRIIVTLVIDYLNSL